MKTGVSASYRLQLGVSLPGAAVAAAVVAADVAVVELAPYLVVQLVVVAAEGAAEAERPSVSVHQPA